MYNGIGKQKYISPKMLMCGSYTDEYNTVVPDSCWHRKECLHILNLIFCTITFKIGPGNTMCLYGVEFSVVDIA